MLLINQTAGIAIVDVVKQGGLVSFFLAEMLAAFTVGRVCRRPATYWAPVIILGEGWTYYAVHGGQISDFVFTALLYGGAWLVGLALREREQRIHDLVAEAAALRADTEAQAQRAVAAERQRIARELHDLVSHSISVMAVQTQVVRLRLPGDQDQDKRELRAVETTARQALAEMRRMLGMLRDSDTRIDLAPTPGLSQLAGLLAEHEAAGGLVQHAISGHPRALPAGVDLAAYRVVQEALTNSRKHSATNMPIRVSFHYTPSTVTVTVTDPGPARRRSAGHSGHGLLGMRERVLLYGGTLHAGAGPDGSWTVVAVLPVNDACAG